jgi:hypothetical protein
MVVPFSVYKDSDNLYKNEQTIQKIVEGPQKECGPYDTLDEALKKIKPDEFVPFCKDGVKDAICPTDPLKWWIVNKIPPCFSWLNGQCSDDKCGFNHGKGTFIKVLVVDTSDMFRIRVNKNRKIRLNCMKKRAGFYIDIFTNEQIPIYYTQDAKNTYNKTKKLKSQIVCEIKSVNKIKKIINSQKQVVDVDVDETKPVEKKSSWADMAEEEEVLVEKEKEKKRQLNGGNWAKIVKGKPVPE